MNNNFICSILCFNNEKIIQKLIDDFNACNELKEVDLVFIDDSSSDQTHRILLENNLSIVKHEKNMGYGAAVKSSFRYAKNNKSEYLCIFPGDYQRSIEDLLLMIKMQRENNFDLISGSKFNHIKSIPTHRKIGNLFYSNLAKYLWNSSLEDVLSGFKLYKIEKFSDLIELMPNNYSFDIVLNQVFSSKKFLCKEFDAKVKYNDQTSKMKSVFYLGKKNILYIGINMFFSTISALIKIKIFKKFK
jgi:GT2 family glycosyltransferase